MSQPRSDSIFLLTLVDFLIQVIFFGLFIFVVYQTVVQRDRRRYDPAAVDRAVETAGVSNLTELVDELSKLAPVRLKGFNATLGNEANEAQVRRAAEAIKEAGGASGVSNAMQRLAKLERGSGLPACIDETVDGSRRVVPLATATGTGSSIVFDAPTPQLDTLLDDIGLGFGSVKSLSLRDFPRVFQRVLTKHPNCRYTIVLRETTRMVNARDAAGQIFYLKLRR
ncbi:hypothetical protein [Sphingomonas aerolata]|uniref:hypothetical protein n=1 Tax=Sphingomonas aerolata TaxID=185951 RepID=UPI00141AD31C|nr:hypothetical protein [Sphingomonas aerolata]NII58336.1 hypothetical protein [Sphingomonas aerolata]